MTDYLHLTLPEIRSELEQAASTATHKFGALDAAQLNWKPRAESWSVAQVLEHLLAANRSYYPILDGVLAGTYPRSVWQRLPGLPGMWGNLMIKSLMPSATRKLKSPAAGRPTTSEIDARVVARFAAEQEELTTRLQAVADKALGVTIFSSPFAKPVTYSLLDAGRILVAHQHRHFGQAERVMQTPGFPESH